MNDRSTVLLLITVLLAGYGLYIAGHVPAMLVGQPLPLLLIGFVLQVVCALAAAFGVWHGQPWGAAAVVLLGVSSAATWLVEGFVLGIVAYLHALLVAVLAIVVALIIAAYVNAGTDRGSSELQQPRLQGIVPYAPPCGGFARLGATCDYPG